MERLLGKSPGFTGVLVCEFGIVGPVVWPVGCGGVLGGVTVLVLGAGATGTLGVVAAGG